MGLIDTENETEFERYETETYLARFVVPLLSLLIGRHVADPTEVRSPQGSHHRAKGRVEGEEGFDWRLVFRILRFVGISHVWLDVWGPWEGNILEDFVERIQGLGVKVGDEIEHALR